MECYKLHDCIYHAIDIKNEITVIIYNFIEDNRFEISIKNYIYDDSENMKKIELSEFLLAYSEVESKMKKIVGL